MIHSTIISETLVHVSVLAAQDDTLPLPRLSHKYCKLQVVIY